LQFDLPDLYTAYTPRVRFFAPRNTKLKTRRAVDNFMFRQFFMTMVGGAAALEPRQSALNHGPEYRSG
jgi:hypothetical protein